MGNSGYQSIGITDDMVTPKKLDRIYADADGNAITNVNQLSDNYPTYIANSSVITLRGGTTLSYNSGVIITGTSIAKGGLAGFYQNYASLISDVKSGSKLYLVLKWKITSYPADATTFNWKIDIRNINGGAILATITHVATATEIVAEENTTIVEIPVTGDFTSDNLYFMFAFSAGGTVSTWNGEVKFTTLKIYKNADSLDDVNALSDNGVWENELRKAKYAKKVIDHSISMNSLTGDVQDLLLATLTKLIICLGDSLTAGDGGDGTSYPSILQSLITSAGLSQAVVNMGISGETSQAIAARFGAIPIIVNPFTIPGSTTPVEITIQDFGGMAISLLNMGTANNVKINPCTINGIDGTLSKTDNKYYFTRSKTDVQVVINRPVKLITYASQNYRNSNIIVVWIGTNNSSDTVDKIIKIQNLIKEYALTDKYLIVGITNDTRTDCVADNNEMALAHGNKFLDLKTYLINYGLQDAGITATTQDNTDISNGVVPTSLRVDATHYTASGYTVIGNAIYKKLLELGYLESAS